MVTPSESQIERTQTKKQKAGHQYISVFVAYSYVNKADEPPELSNPRRAPRQSDNNSTRQEDMDIIDSKSERHLYVFCPVVRDGDCCLRTGRLRDAGIVHHDCTKLTQRSIQAVMKQRSSHSQSTAAPSSNEVDYREEIKNLLVSFIAGTPVSFRLIGSPQFKDLLLRIVEIGRSHVSVPPDQLLPPLSVHTIPSMLKVRASELYTELLSSLRDSYVTINIDSAVIGHNNYLAVTTREVRLQSPVYFVQLLNSPSTKDDYVFQISSIIEFLRRHHIFVISICCDGATAQVSSIREVRSQLNNPHIPIPLRLPTLPLHIPCFNHRVNLALQRATKSPVLSKVISELQEFASLASTKAYRSKLGKAAPSFISTRWFSLWNIASFIRLHRDIIISNNFLPEKSLFDILKAEILLTPFTELTLFFESDKVQLSCVYPAVLRAFAEYSYIANHTYFNSGDWLYATIHCMVELYNYCFTGTIGYLIAVAFWLHPYGRILRYQNKIRSGYRIDISLFESFSRQFVLFPSPYFFFLDNSSRLLLIPLNLMRSTQ